MKKVFIGIVTFVMMAVLCVVSAGAENIKEPYMYHYNIPIYLSDDELYFYTITSDNTVSIQWYRGYETEITFPEAIDGMMVTKIDGLYDAAYASGVCPEGTVKITIPSTITYIRECSFQACPSLKEIIVDKDNTSYYSYDGCLYKTSTETLIRVPCTKKSVELSPTIKYINLTYSNQGYDSFDGCSALTSVSVATSNEIFTCIDGIIYSKDKTVLKYIPNGSEKLFIPKETYQIGLGVSYSGLSYISVEDGNENYSSYDGALYTADKKTFLVCPGQKTSLVVAAETNSIKDEALRSNKLQSVTLGKGLTSIDYRLFYYCSSLSEVVFPNSITTIGQEAFYKCTSLTKISIPDSVTTIEYGAFSWCSSLSDVTIPYTVTTISSSVFEGCSDNLIINCYEDSYAHKYAIENEINFKLLLSPVKNLAVKSRNYNSITLSWDKNASASGYILQQYKNNAWTNIANIKDSTVTSYQITNLAANTSYKFRAVAYVTDGEATAYSSYTSALTVSTAPAMNANFAITGRGSDYLTITWTKNTGASGYIIQEQVDGVWKNVASIKGNATISYTVANLQPNSFHRYRMVAYKTDANGTCYGKYTGSAPGYTAPAMVTGLGVFSDTATSIAISWDKVTSANGYVIDIYKDGKWSQLVKITSNATTSYKATGLNIGTTYKFRIKSYATNGSLTIYSTYSSAISGVPALSKVENLKMTNRGTDFISVRWDKNADAEGYMVYIYDGSAWKLVKTLTTASSVSHKITGLVSGKAYKVTVKAYKMVNGTKYISDTATISATTL